MEREYLSFEQVSNNYHRIEYLSSDDGEWYELTKYFPFCISVKGEPNQVYLDTGGEMSNCNFNVYQFTKTQLYSQGKLLNKIRFIGEVQL